MSRVYFGQKFYNSPPLSPEDKTPSKITRFVGEDGADYCKVGTLASWLFLKYGMSYKAFHRKSLARKEALRKEYTEDTGKPVKQLVADY